MVQLATDQEAATDRRVRDDYQARLATLDGRQSPAARIEHDRLANVLEQMQRQIAL
jgi:hypothetical protein